MNRIYLAYLIALLASAVWCVLLVAAPYGAHAGGMWGSVADIIYTGFHRICHQYDSRSLHLLGLPLAACSRCTAIYVAFFIGMAAYPFFYSLRTPRSPSRLTFLLALAPMLIDVGLSFAGMHESTTLTRLITGALFGVMLPFVLLPVYLGAVHELITRTPSTHPHMKGAVDA